MTNSYDYSNPLNKVKCPQCGVTRMIHDYFFKKEVCDCCVIGESTVAPKTTYE